MIKFIAMLGSIVLFLSCTRPMPFNSNLTQEQRIQEMKEQYNRIQEKINKNEITFLGGDGLTIENAIIISGAKNEKDGIIAEYLYLIKKLGIRGQDWQLVSQSELDNKGKMIDLMEIQDLKENKKTSYFFDISKFAGKF